MYGSPTDGEGAFVLAAFSTKDDAYDYLFLESKGMEVGICDICNNGIGVMSCIECNYDECRDCFEKAEHQKHNCELVDIYTKKIEKIRTQGYVRNDLGYYKVACVPYGNSDTIVDLLRPPPVTTRNRQRRMNSVARALAKRQQPARQCKANII